MRFAFFSQDMAKADKRQLLEQIKADIIKQNICPDLAQEATQLVFGDGSADADIVFIGEAPGKNEDQQGLPFVGAAGKFLERDAGHDRAEAPGRVHYQHRQIPAAG